VKAKRTGRTKATRLQHHLAAILELLFEHLIPRGASDNGMRCVMITALSSMREMSACSAGTYL
jgi:hypothetical protein